MSDRFDTQAVHAGDVKDQFGALITPVYNTSTFIFDSTDQGARRFALEESGYIYERIGTPTLTTLEEKIATLEHGEAAISCCSGMGAITATIWANINAGEEIVTDMILYGCTFDFFQNQISRFGVKTNFVDTSDLEQVKAAINDKTRIVYLETPANPNLQITDIEEVAKIAHSYNPDILVVVDNTFNSPYLTTPLDLGADIVVHSATKYINGHADLIAGLIIGKAEMMTKIRIVGVKVMTGCCQSSQDAFLVTRGLKTLGVRMQRHCDSAMKIARYLETNDKIEKVYYPGLESHKGHEIAKKQMKNGFGGVVSFVVKGGRDAAARVADSVKLASLAVSLGAVDTLIEHPASMTHSTYTEEELREAGIEPGLIRYAVGLEDVDDLIADLDQALANA